MGAAVLFRDVQIGTVLPPVTVQATCSAIVDYLEATGGPGPVYRPDGRMVAPPTMAAVLLRPVLRSLPSPPGGIHAKQHFRFYAPVIADAELLTSASVREKHIRRGRNYVVMETGIQAADGALLVKGLMTRIWAA